MHIVESYEYLKKSIVYNEYTMASLNGLTDKKVSELFSIQKDDKNISYIKIDLSNVSREIKSIQYWYEQEKEDRKDFSTKMYNFSLPRVEEEVYENGVLVPYKKEIQLEPGAIRLVKFVLNDDSGSVKNFNYSYDNERKIITYEYTSISNGGSIDYVVAFLNESFDENLAKFVFGVNVYDEDFEKGYIRINLSILSTRDTRVYDQKHNLIGYETNYVDKLENKIYGENQYYRDIIKEE